MFERNYSIIKTSLMLWSFLITYLNKHTRMRMQVFRIFTINVGLLNTMYMLLLISINLYESGMIRTPCVIKNSKTGILKNFHHSQRTGKREILY